MSAEKEQSQHAERQPHRPSLLESVIRDNVMRDLGQPEGLHQVQVRPLWANNYRVNVFVGADAASSRVADSFFLETDGEGKVIASSPAIARRY